jgi:aspartate racemase
MAAHYIAEITSLQPTGPYYIGGSSSGGTIAFEMAQQLRARGQEVALLVLFDTFSSFLPDSIGKTLFQRFKSFSYLTRADLHFGNLLQYGPRYLLGRAERLKRITKKRSRRLANRFQIWRRSPLQQTLAKVQEANLQAFKVYVPRVYSGRITLFITGESSLRTYQDGRLGWSELAGDGLELHIVRGDHLSMIEDMPHVIILAEKLRTCLSRAQPSKGAASSERSI